MAMGERGKDLHSKPQPCLLTMPGIFSAKGHTISAPLSCFHVRFYDLLGGWGTDARSQLFCGL